MNFCVVGLQWGDEGKGKVVDILAENADLVVRYGGGANAGHTVIIGDTKFALHLMPSGAVRPAATCVIANGVVVDPAILLEEKAGLEQKGLSLNGRLWISSCAHVVLDYHKTEDRLREEALGAGKIGTTARGIGPCYADKTNRSYALRMGDLLDTAALKSKLKTIIEYKNKFFSAMYQASPISFDEIYQKCLDYSRLLSPFICNTTELLHNAMNQNKTILFEGAQGSLLDIDHGTFPFVTSSNASALGLGPGCGVPPQKIQRFIGVVKAYMTRVGSGPFPAEQDNEIGQRIRDRGHEYGTTTGRPRRCGWFDAVAVRYSVAISGITDIAMMHLDTLAGFEELKICTAYEIDGKKTDFFPADSVQLSKAKCIYQTLPGWKEDLSEITQFEKLPQTTQHYIKTIELLVGVPIKMIGIGPKRTQVISR
jgi:adenylosuccinate synthase